MKITSNSIDTLPRSSFAGSPETALQSPLAHPCRTSCATLKPPPVKSSKTLDMFHPSVLWRLQFIHTCGQYLQVEMTTFTSDSSSKYVSQLATRSELNQIAAARASATQAKADNPTAITRRSPRSALSPGG